jgi:hypothetical protein
MARLRRGGVVLSGGSAAESGHSCSGYIHEGVSAVRGVGRAELDPRSGAAARSHRAG